MVDLARGSFQEKTTETHSMFQSKDVQISGGGKICNPRDTTHFYGEGSISGHFPNIIFRKHRTLSMYLPNTALRYEGRPQN